MSFLISLFPSQDFFFFFNVHEEPEAGLRYNYVNSPHKVIETQCEEVYSLKKQKRSMCVRGGLLMKYFRDSKSLLF